MRPSIKKIRLSIPFWGESYLQKALNITLPAMLAPGNVPALATEFDVEVALVTEARFSEVLIRSPAYRNLTQHADVRIVQLDDLLTGVGGDYGPVLTFALIRGYEDLGQRMLEYFLMFLNADFVLADGCYRTIARLIKEGHQVIHCPSFRAVEEEVLPSLEANVRQGNGVLAMRPRKLMDLALRHKHISVKARTINQKLYHQRYMDQFYWFVDECTLLGYQWPVALVGLQPERVVTKPTLMFDYGFIPEICPTAEKHYIADSDEFCMLELQERLTGQELVQLGWTSPRAIATYLSDYSTREQRECGEQMHVFHSADLPDSLPIVAAESRRYIGEILGYLGPPMPHDNHPKFSEWWSGVLARIEAAPNHHATAFTGTVMEAAPSSGPVLVRADQTSPRETGSVFRRILKTVFRTIFGEPRSLKPTHPLWIDTYLLGSAYKSEVLRGARVLCVTAGDTVLAQMAGSPAVLLRPSDLAGHLPLRLPAGATTFDACFFQLSAQECGEFSRMYDRVRTYVRDGGHIYLNVVNVDGRSLPQGDVMFCEAAMPDKDISELSFDGGFLTRIIRETYVAIAEFGLRHRRLRWLAEASSLLLLAPFAYVANLGGSRGASPLYNNRWLVMFGRFTVVRRDPAKGISDGLYVVPPAHADAHN